MTKLSLKSQGNQGFHVSFADNRSAYCLFLASCLLSFLPHSADNSSEYCVFLASCLRSFLTELLDKIEGTGSALKLDDWQERYPTNVEDLAQIIEKLANLHEKNRKSPDGGEQSNCAQ